jgi:hypothetical protein
LSTTGGPRVVVVTILGNVVVTGVLERAGATVVGVVVVVGTGRPLAANTTTVEAVVIGATVATDT